MKRINFQLFLLFYAALAAIPALGQKLIAPCSPSVHRAESDDFLARARSRVVLNNMAWMSMWCFLRQHDCNQRSGVQRRSIGAFGASSSVLANLGGMGHRADRYRDARVVVLSGDKRRNTQRQRYEGKTDSPRAGPAPIPISPPGSRWRNWNSGKKR